MKKFNKGIVITLILIFLLQLFAPICFAEVNNTGKSAIDRWYNEHKNGKMSMSDLMKRIETISYDGQSDINGYVEYLEQKMKNDGKTDSQIQEEFSSGGVSKGTNYNMQNPYEASKGDVSPELVDTLNATLDKKAYNGNLEEFAKELDGDYKSWTPLNNSGEHLSGKDTINLLLNNKINNGEMTEEKAKEVFPEFTRTQDTIIEAELKEGNDVFSTAISWGAGLLYYPFKLIIGLIREVLEGLASWVSNEKNVTAQDILFNKVELVNANFFTPIEITQNNQKIAFVNDVRNSVATWYYAMRTIAIMASIAVLVYIAIRMALSTVGREEGKYKKMLKDWLMSFSVIFVLHYIMRIILFLNDKIVEIMASTLEHTGTSALLEKYLEQMRAMSFLPSALSFEQLGADIVSLMLAGITLAFLFMYIKRFIVIAFLAIISPLVTITYAIDKVGDGKAQAMHNWFNEFLWTVLVQPFHCIIYLVFVTTALTLLKDASFGSSVLAIYCMMFILQAEEIVKKIFGVGGENVGKLGAGTAFIAGVATTRLSKIAGGVRDMAGSRRTKPNMVPPAPTGANNLAAIPNAPSTANIGARKCCRKSTCCYCKYANGAG